MQGTCRHLIFPLFCAASGYARIAYASYGDADPWKRSRLDCQNMQWFLTFGGRLCHYMAIWERAVRRWVRMLALTSLPFAEAN